MAGQLTSRIPASLNVLKRLGNKRMADAHQAVADARRIACENAAIRAETKSLHDRFHQSPPALALEIAAAELRQIGGLRNVDNGPRG